MRIFFAFRDIFGDSMRRDDRGIQPPSPCQVIAGVSVFHEESESDIGAASGMAVHVNGFTSFGKEVQYVTGNI